MFTHAPSRGGHQGAQFEDYGIEFTYIPFVKNSRGYYLAFEEDISFYMHICGGKFENSTAGCIPQIVCN